MVVIKWVNKFSKESGYIKSISKKERHFNNAEIVDDARTWLNTKLAEKDISLLAEFGETQNNDFIIETV